MSNGKGYVPKCGVCHKRRSTIQMGTYIPFKANPFFFCTRCYRRRYPVCPKCRQDHKVCTCIQPAEPRP